MSWTDLLFCRQLARLTHRKPLPAARKATIRRAIRNAGPAPTRLSFFRWRETVQH